MMAIRMKMTLWMAKWKKVKTSEVLVSSPNGETSEVGFAAGKSLRLGLSLFSTPSPNDQWKEKVREQRSIILEPSS